MPEHDSHDEELRALELEERRQRIELTKQQVREFKEKKENEERVRKIRVIAIQKQQEEEQRRQKVCRHKTGGKGKPGFLNGDGAKGYCVATHVLPTKEVYYLCTRCQKEWHHPQWVVKTQVYYTGKTTVTKSQWDTMLKEYQEAALFDHPYTETSEASLFNIPLLDRIDVNKIPLASEA